MKSKIVILIFFIPIFLAKLVNAQILKFNPVFEDNVSGAVFKYFISFDDNNIKALYGIPPAGPQGLTKIFPFIRVFSPDLNSAYNIDFPEETPAKFAIYEYNGHYIITGNSLNEELKRNVNRIINMNVEGEVLEVNDFYPETYNYVKTPILSSSNDSSYLFVANCEEKFYAVEDYHINIYNEDLILVFSVKVNFRQIFEKQYVDPAQCRFEYIDKELIVFTFLSKNHAGNLAVTKFKDGASSPEYILDTLIEYNKGYLLDQFVDNDYIYNFGLNYDIEQISKSNLFFSKFNYYEPSKSKFVICTREDIQNKSKGAYLAKDAILPGSVYHLEDGFLMLNKYYNNDNIILLIKFDTDFNIEWVKKINRSLPYNCVYYKAFEEDNQVYLFYYDSEENFNINDGNLKAVKLKKSEEKCLILAKISSDGSIDKEIIHRSRIDNRNINIEKIYRVNNKYYFFDFVEGSPKNCAIEEY